MKRREFLRLTSSTAIGATLLDVSCSSAKRTDPRPNIIFILSDDQGWGDIGYHGSEISTPNLDRLAETGVRLEKHYVHPVCSPTRAALLTGVFPSRFAITGAIAADSKQILPTDVTTLPGLLSECGYKTHISGKWHLALTKDLGPTKYGFQTSYGYLHGQIDPYLHEYKLGDRTWHRNDELMDEEGHATDLITDDAVRFIRSSGESPFFLYVAYSVPHYPLAEPEEWTAPYEGQIEERSRRLYAASLSHMDEGIGRIVSELEEAGLREDTIVVYSSDNGGQEDWLNTEGMYDNRFPPDPVLGNNGDLRGWKGDVYDGGIRVPALVNWPGTLSPAISTEPMHIVDWLPTFAGLAEFAGEYSRSLDGHNVMPALSGTGEKIPLRPIYIKAGSGSALIYGEWKLIELRSGETQLFNLRSDPGERVNRAPDEPGTYEKLLAILRKQQAADGEPTFWEPEAQ